MSDIDGSTGGISKRKAKKEKKLEAIKAAKKVFQSVDGQVQHTNDDSVVSKRSAVIHGYMQDPFLRIFVKSKARRSPLINRGYYLRMKVITEIVSEAIDAMHKKCNSADTPIQVISLGAGYDTFALRCLLSSEKKAFYAKNVQFYDVDFDAVMKSKCNLLAAAPEGTIPQNWILKVPEGASSVYIQSPSYRAVGVDLREAEKELVIKLKQSNSNFSVDHPTIIYAECVMQYMPYSAAYSLLQLLSLQFPNMIFFAYDQLHAEDSFGKVMEQSLKMRNSPLLGIEACGNGTAMVQRALKAGMKTAAFSNFYDLSRHYIDAKEDKRLSLLEPFDEVEEWSEMCEHYGITMGCTFDLGCPPHEWHPCFKENSCGTLQNLEGPICDHQVVECISQPWPFGRFRFERWGFGEMEMMALPPSSLAVGEEGDTVFVAFGGFSAGKNAHSRVNTVFCHSLRRGDLEVVVTGECVPPSLIFHSFSKVSSHQYLVFGGRTSPSDVSNNTFLLTLSGIEEGQSVISARWDVLGVTGAGPAARSRHAAAFCPNSDDGSLFIFGGRGPEGVFLGDAWIGTLSLQSKKIDWNLLPLSGQVPPSPCCSAAALYYQKRVILSGGLQDNFIASDAVTSIDITSGDCFQSKHRIGKRYSHSMTLTKLQNEDCVFILGGSVCDSKETIRSALLLDPVTLSWISSVNLSHDNFWWSRHSCVSMADGVLAVVGGGYTCFSFGTATARPTLLLLGGAKFTPMDQRRSLEQQHGSAVLASGLLPVGKAVLQKDLTPDTFQQVVSAATVPVLFKNVDFGECRRKWRDPSYLCQAEGQTMVSVHVATGSCVLDFVNKNFTFRHISFPELIQHAVTATHHYREHGVVPAETFYFRSISSHMKTERANIWKDFPRIGCDFCLPKFVHDFIAPRIHQACWRINSFPMTLWMHYDTLDNVLCQVVGRKRVTLFPPSQYNNLYMVDSSSQVLSMSDPDLERFPRFIDASKKKTEVILEPGDMIFIPALWFHHIETIDSDCDDYSISVNVFFEHFESSLYDKKDLYGNKDIPKFAALRSSLVSHTTELLTEFEGSPPSHSSIKYTEFALREAIQDLEALANALAAKSQSFE